ncbi:MAG: Calcineurin-like phosphoesterase superfamily domain protein [Bacteroidetes bacterium ADurb.Bin217]|nr:MAG: Calcineurin-like phosphoesterase superfamily domain protein [Bacteroidetes bacterium ADurb.Bin217]
MLIVYNQISICCISDTHGKHRDLSMPAADICIHCGDACTDGNIKQLQDFFAWFSELEYRHKIFVPGNHDLLFELHPIEFYAMMPNQILLLHDSHIEIMGIRFLALSPYFTYTYHGKTKVDILLSHQPAYGVLDAHVGSVDLRNFIENYSPSYCICGHIHDKRGMLQVANTTYVNCCI